MSHRNLPSPFNGGLVSWRLVALHWAACLLGLQVKVEGYPYGTLRNVDLGKREAISGAGMNTIGQP